MKIFISSIYLVMQMGMQLYSESSAEIIQLDNQYFVTQSDYVTASDFELVGGLIFVEAELNGKKEKFILDTGAPHFLLNEKNEKRRKSNLWMNGIGGSKKMSKVRNLDFDWQGITAKRNVKYAVDLENIAKAKNRDLGGLIGYDQVRNKELVLDYDNQKLFLLSRKNKDFFNNHKKVDKARIRMVGHLPVVKVKIGKKKYYFAIDTGAETNVIDKRLKNKIPKDLIQIGFKSSIVGRDSQDINVHGMELETIKVGKSQYEDMPFIFTDLSFLNLETDFKIDGLLGYQFLRRAKFSIDYKKKKLNKWELKVKKEEETIQQEPIQKTVPDTYFTKRKKFRDLFLTKPLDVNPALAVLKLKLIKSSLSIVYKFQPEIEIAEFTFSGK